VEGRVVDGCGFVKRDFLFGTLDILVKRLVLGRVEEYREEIIKEGYHFGKVALVAASSSGCSIGRDAAWLPVMESSKKAIVFIRARSMGLGGLNWMAQRPARSQI